MFSYVEEVRIVGPKHCDQHGARSRYNPIALVGRSEMQVVKAPIMKHLVVERAPLEEATEARRQIVACSHLPFGFGQTGSQCRRERDLTCT